ncbi:MAG: type II secretion system protein, partial [Verrucomicrobiaceae bacterium]
MTFMIKTHRRGFTLIELLVVISIVAVLSTLAAVMAPKILKKSAQTKTVQSLQRMASSLTLYANDNANRIPPPMTPASENEEKDD